MVSNDLGIDNKLKQTRNENPAYFISDHLGSTNALTDDLGNLLNSTSYDGFGNATNGSFSEATWYQYTGREYDDFLKMYDFCAHRYDAEIGQFVA